MNKNFGITFAGDIQSQTKHGNASWLVWGVKESFRQYFERLPDHSYDLGPGVTRTSEGLFEFMAQPKEGLEFRGRLGFDAHFGALSVTIKDPSIKDLNDGRGVLTAVVDEQDGEPVRMAVANLQFSHWNDVAGGRQAIFDAVLAQEGQYLFMGNYFEGDLLDPVVISFGVGHSE